MEKHEDSCMYKKQSNPGRKGDDRVGSYECIGRIVFRTCAEDGENGRTSIPSAEGDKSLERTPPSAEGDKLLVRTPSPPITSVNQLPVSTASGSRARAANMPQRRHQGPYQTEKPRYEQVMFATTATYSSAAPVRKFSNEDFTKPISTDEMKLALIRKALVRPEFNFPPFTVSNRPRSEQKFISYDRNSFDESSSTEIKPPEPNQFLIGNFDKLYTSKKAFPIYTSRGNQNDTKLNASDETITTLTELSKNPAKKKKSGFFGTMFRNKNSASGLFKRYPK